MKSNKPPKKVEENFEEMRQHWDSLKVTRENPASDKNLKAFGFAILGLIFTALFGAGLFFTTADLFEISVFCRTTVGSVIDYKYEQRTKRKGRIRREHNHLIVYEGNRKWFDLGRQYPSESQFHIRYSTKDPEIARVTREKSLWRLLQQELGWTGLFLAAGFLLFGYNTLLHFRDLLFVPSDEIDN